MLTLSHARPRVAGLSNQRLDDALQAGCGGYQCDATTATLRRRLVRGGTVIVALQCDGCGRAVATFKRDEHYYWQGYPEWDEEIRRVHDDALQVRSAESLADLDDRLAVIRRAADERRAHYREVFLRSPAWRALRGKVLGRANGLCEACLSAPASDVHHTTYRHGVLPPAWMLRAVCRDCHDRLHDWWDGDEPAA